MSCSLFSSINFLHLTLFCSIILYEAIMSVSLILFVFVIIHHPTPAPARPYSIIMSSSGGDTTSCRRVVCRGCQKTFMELSTHISLMPACNLHYMTSHDPEQQQQQIDVRQQEIHLVVSLVLLPLPGNKWQTMTTVCQSVQQPVEATSITRSTQGVALESITIQVSGSLPED